MKISDSSCPKIAWIGPKYSVKGFSDVFVTDNNTVCTDHLLAPADLIALV